jgi:sulfite reductase alpha subunit-like flavoprotein
MMFRTLPPFGNDPRNTAEIVNGIMNGKTNNTGLITLATSNAITTTLYDERISRDTKIILIPFSAAAYDDTAPYGQFSNNTDQLAPSAGTSAVVTWDATDFSNGIYLSNTTRLNVRNSGTYNVQFSLQLQNSTNEGQHADVWFRVNGTDVTSSASRFGLPPRKSSGDPSNIIGSINIFLDLDANDYVEIAGAVTNVGVTLEHFAADTGIPRPAIPAAIVTMNYVAPQAYSNVFVTAQQQGQATITHWSNNTADKTYAYVLVG